MVCLTILAFTCFCWLVQLATFLKKGVEASNTPHMPAKSRVHMGLKQARAGVCIVEPSRSPYVAMASLHIHHPPRLRSNVNGQFHDMCVWSLYLREQSVK